MFVFGKINIVVEKTHTKYDGKLSVGINFLSETLFNYSCTAFKLTSANMVGTVLVKLIFLIILSIHKYVKFKPIELFICWQN